MSPLIPRQLTVCTSASAIPPSARVPAVVTASCDVVTVGRRSHAAQHPVEQAGQAQVDDLPVQALSAGDPGIIPLIGLAATVLGLAAFVVGFAFRRSRSTPPREKPQPSEAENRVLDSAMK